MILRAGQRQELIPTERERAELLSLDRLIAGLRVERSTERRTGNLRLTRGAREVILFPGKSLASVDGDLRLLSARVIAESGRFLVPVDSVPMLLEPLLGMPVRWHSGPRVLAIGAVSAPRIEVRTEVSGDRVRVALEASERVPFAVTEEERRVTVSVQEDLVDVSFQQQQLTGGIVERVQYVGGRRNTFAIALGQRFRSLTVNEDDPLRLTLEFEAKPLPRRAADVSPRPTPDRGERPPDEPRTPVVVIDPGHGGSNIGAQGREGTVEKTVTLEIARKLRSSVVNSLGYRVFLTRESDQEVELDDRAAIANNYKADLFVSIHANGWRGRAASGSEVYFLSYQASDDDARRVALAEGGATPPEAADGSPLSLILWDMAQAEHLEESSRLASRIQEELAIVTGSEGRGIKQAPFRVLVGAAMPAVLVEVAFISNPGEEQLLKSEAYQWRIASALMRGIARFMVQRQRRLPAAAGR